jgi:hypothetical protein
MIIGIDPGASGAAVCLFGYLDPLILRFSKLTWEEVSQKIPNGNKPSYAYVEMVSAMPKDGAHNAFTFGENTGIIKGILYTWKIPIIEVHSQKWQKEFGLGAKFPSKTARKNAQKQKAQELFPDIKVTLDIADALLIAEYGRRQHGK